MTYGMNTYGTRRLYCCQSSPYFSAHISSSRIALQCDVMHTSFDSTLNSDDDDAISCTITRYGV